MNGSLPRARSFGRLALGVLLVLAACSDPTSRIDGPSDRPSAAKKPRTTVPGAPTGVTAVAGHQQATVQWTAPSNDGNSAILSYRVVASPGGKTVTVTAPSTTTTVTGLTNGTAYTFTVAATNAIGTGAISSASAAVTPKDTTTPPLPPPGSRWMMGYYAGYQRSLYPETSVDFSKLTHIAMGAAIPLADATLDTTFFMTNSTGPAVARTLASRAHQAGRKAILMLGGAGYYNGFVSAASSTNRTKFIANILATMDKLGYDGVDVDWEPINATDRPNVLALLQALRAARPTMLITIPVGWANSNFPGDIDAWFGQVAASVDQMNVMSYSMAGPWGGWVSWHHSALTGEGGNHPSSVSSSVNLYLAAGVPAAKLGIGLGAYGSCWKGVTAPLQSTTSASLTDDDNQMSFATIMSSYYVAANRAWDATAQAPYLSFASGRGPLGCTFISYEDEQSATAKGAFIKSKGIGGAIMWTIGEQHTGSGDPLLAAAYNAIVP